MMFAKKTVLFYMIVAVKGELRKFPDTLSFGVGTSAFQIEGGWNASDKGESVLDHISHHTNKFSNNGDIACDSYHQYKRDVEMLVELGVDFYRFSLSWSRILPEGFSNKISKDGVAYYNSLIDDLLKANITPTITLHHWDLPQRFADIGGWYNPLMIDYFADFAEVAFKTFGDRVKTWITFNEPRQMCILFYSENYDGIGEYICGHNLLKAHAKVYHLYDDKYKPTQKGKIGWTLCLNWLQPETQSPADIEATERSTQFDIGWFANPVFSNEGDYPEIMKEYVNRNSLEEGYLRSRLPKFTPEEIEYIKGTHDFFGLNHYTSALIKNRNMPFIRPSLWNDVSATIIQDPTWPDTGVAWLKITPWGFRGVLNLIREKYNNPEVIIFENGFVGTSNINDTDRIDFYNQYLNALLDAIEDGCNVTAFTAWSLMDNLEWFVGYKHKFGLYYVDFNDPNRKRTPKASAFYYKSILETRTIKRDAKSMIKKRDKVK